MNAYELADKLEKRELEAMEYGFDKELFEATELLRQQADRIAELEKYFEAWKLLNNGMIELGSKARKVIEP